MPLVAALVVHLFSFWGGAWLAGSPDLGDSSWLLCYLGGAALLIAGSWCSRLRLGAKAALEVLGYSVLLAVLFWGANMALDVLGNSVRTGRLPSELRTGLPLHFFLVPGVASVGLGALVAALLRRAVLRLSRGARVG